MCGGNLLTHTLKGETMGLSPRVRGKPSSHRIKRSNQRSIPACAGETSLTAIFQPLIGVYPRVCGGNMAFLRNRTTTAGLSPRVRGKRRAGLGVARRMGSIPACAGETGWGIGLATVFVVYPRVCGGNWPAMPRLTQP